MKFTSLLQHPYVKALRQVLGHVAVGLGFTWACLMALELWRPGAVAWVVDLNLLLALFGLTWLLGQPQARGQRTYAVGSAFAILAVATAIALSAGSAYLWWVPLAALGASLVLIRAFRTAS